MLSLLLDENLLPVIATQVFLKRTEIAVQSVHTWHGGKYKGQQDEEILRAAAVEGLTLVTCDIKSILPKLAKMGMSGVSHGGVIFVDNRTISQRDPGTFVLSLIALWDSCHMDSWTNRSQYLRPPEE